VLLTATSESSKSRLPLSTDKKNLSPYYGIMMLNHRRQKGGDGLKCWEIFCQDRAEDKNIINVCPFKQVFKHLNLKYPALEYLDTIINSSTPSSGAITS
jgi:hypothetical protein